MRGTPRWFPPSLFAIRKSCPLVGEQQLLLIDPGFAPVGKQIGDYVIIAPTAAFVKPHLYADAVADLRAKA